MLGDVKTLPRQVANTEPELREPVWIDRYISLVDMLLGKSGEEDEDDGASRRKIFAA